MKKSKPNLTCRSSKLSKNIVTIKHLDHQEKRKIFKLMERLQQEIQKNRSLARQNQQLHKLLKQKQNLIQNLKDSQLEIQSFKSNPTSQQVQKIEALKKYDKLIFETHPQEQIYKAQRQYAEIQTVSTSNKEIGTQTQQIFLLQPYQSEKRKTIFKKQPRKIKSNLKIITQEIYQIDPMVDQNEKIEQIPVLNSKKGKSYTLLQKRPCIYPGNGKMRIDELASHL